MRTLLPIAGVYENRLSHGEKGSAIRKALLHEDALTLPGAVEGIKGIRCQALQSGEGLLQSPL